MHETKYRSSGSQPRSGAKSARDVAPAIDSLYVNNSPDAVAQRELSNGVVDSPYLVIQRKLFSAMFGYPAQLQSLPARGETSAATVAATGQTVQFGGAFSGLRGRKKDKDKQPVPNADDSDLEGIDPDLSFDFPLDPQSDATRPFDAPDSMAGQKAAFQFIDGHDSAFARLRGETVSATAQNPEVHKILIQAMGIWIDKQPIPGYYDDLRDMATFGLDGNCMVVSPIFGYLLNAIHRARVTRVHRPGGLGGPHTMLATTGQESTSYIDATWRQGGGPYDTNEGPRRQLPLVRVSEVEPTISEVDAAVKRALKM